MTNMEKSEDTYLYIVFSHTPCKMGIFIRAVTHGAYNHVSVALDENLSEMYSFARLKRDTPFCGGFVHEGAERYKRKERTANISICEIQVGKEEIEKVRSRIKNMEEQREAYLYNLISAVLVPIHKKAYARDSYTCVEFASAILKIAGVKWIRECYSASELYAQLQDWEVYRGEYPESASIVDECYYDRISFSRRIYDSVKQFRRLLNRLY